MPPPDSRTHVRRPDRSAPSRVAVRACARLVAIAIASLALAGPAAAALLPELGERAVVPGSTFSLPIVAGEPEASVFIERAPVGVELVADGPERWTLRWAVPSRPSGRTVIRLGAVDRSDRSRRESADLVLVREGSGAAPRPPPELRPAPPEAVPEAISGPGADVADGLEIPVIPPLALVAGDAWALTVSVRDAGRGTPASAMLELRGAPPGLTSAPSGDGWYTLRWRPSASVTGTWTVELVASALDDPTRRARRRLVLEVRPPTLEVPAAGRGAPDRSGEAAPVPPPGAGPGAGPVAATRAAPRLAELPHHVVNPGQDVAFRVETVEPGRARIDIDRLPRGARFDANEDGSRSFYWPTSDRDQGEHRFRVTAADVRDPSLVDTSDVLVIVGDPSRGRTVPAGDPVSGAPGAPGG